MKKIFLFINLLIFSYTAINSKDIPPELNDVVDKCYTALEENKSETQIKEYILVLNDVFPESPETIFLTGWYLIKLDINKAKGLTLLSQYIYSHNDFIRYKDTAEKIYLNNKYNKNLVDLYYRAREQESLENQNLKQAVKLYQSILKQDNTFEEAKWRAAYIYYSLQDTDKALNLIKDSYFIESQLLLFDIYYMDYDENRNRLKNLIRDIQSNHNNYDNPDVLIRAARLLYILPNSTNSTQNVAAGFSLRKICQKLKKYKKYRDEIIYYDNNIGEEYITKFADSKISAPPVISSINSNQCSRKIQLAHNIFKKILRSAKECFGFEKDIKLTCQDKNISPISEVYYDNSISVNNALADYIDKNFNEFREDVWAIILSHEIAHIINGDYNIKRFILNNVKHIRTKKESFIKMECEADRKGIFIALKAGYNPKYLITVLKQFYKDFGSDIEHPFLTRINNANETYRQIYLAYDIFQDGIYYFRNRKYNEALKKFLLFRTFFPNHKQAINNIALIYYYKAVRNYSRQFKLISDIDCNIGFKDPRIIFRGSRSLANSKKIDYDLLRKAIQIMENLLIQYPAYEQGINNLACMYIDNKEISKASAKLNLLPDDFIPGRNNIAVLYAIKNKRNKAVKIFIKTLNSDNIKYKYKKIIKDNLELLKK